MAQFDWIKAVSGEFSDAADWTGGAVPGAGDDAGINLAGTYTVTISTPEAVNSLTVDDTDATVADSSMLAVGSALVLMAGTFELDKDGVVDGGTLSASGGTFDWDGGTLSGVTYEGTLDLTAANAALSVKGGLKVTGAGGSGSGVIDLAGDARDEVSSLTITDAEALNNLTLDIGALGAGFGELIGDDVLNLGSNLNIVGAEGEITSAHAGVINDGTISLGVAATGLFEIVGTSFVNNGLIVVEGGENFAVGPNLTNAAGGSILISGLATLDLISNTGTVVVDSGGTLFLAGSFGPAVLDDVTNQGGTIYISGTLDNSGSTLDVGPGTASPLLNLGNAAEGQFGEINGGTVVDGGSGLIIQRGTLSGVTYDGTLNCDLILYVTGGLTLNGVDGTGPGTIDLNGDFFALGNETLDNATLNIDFGELTPLSNNSVLTLGSHFNVVETGTYAQIGQIGEPSQGVVNEGSITAGISGGVFEIRAASFVNDGSITVGNGETLDLGVDFGTGQTFTFTQSSDGVISVGAGSTAILTGTDLIGGTLETSGDGLFETFYRGDVLDGVDNEGTFEVADGTKLTLEGAIGNTGVIEVQTAADTALLIAAAGATLTGAGSIVLEGGWAHIAGLAVSATLTNDSTISGAGNVGQSYLTLVNQASGVIDADAATVLAVDTAGETLVNDGLLEATAAGGLIIKATSVDGSGGGVIDAAGGKVRLQGADIVGGTLEFSAGSSIQIQSGTDLLDGTVSVVANEGRLVIDSGQNLTLEGAIDNKGVIGPNSKGPTTTLTIGAAGATLSGGGEVALNGQTSNLIIGATAGATLTNADNTIAGMGDIGGGEMTLVNEAGGYILAELAHALIIDTGSNTIVNAGKIEASGAGGAIIESAIDNTGVLMADGGDLSVDGAVTGSGRAVVENGTLSFAAAFSENVAFGGTSGELVLAQSQGYGGTISGFSKTSGDTLDLEDIGFVSGSTSAAYGGGVLTVSEGTDTARVKLSGAYTGVKFNLATDGHGGTLVTASTPTPAVTLFIAAMATLGAPAVGSVAAGAAAVAQPATLVVPATT